ncbi:MAG: ABC transporter ATP-binding protein [Chloroflexi bacterium]|nr:ABC transporter ATP-binding protein [Chloroflexota bacterium]
MTTEPVIRPAAVSPDGTPSDPGVILAVRDLQIAYRTARGSILAVRGATFDLHRGESLALIGESGSGKTTLGLALMRLLPRAAQVIGGSLRYRWKGDEVDLLTLDPERLRRFRGEACAMVFQGAQNALNPVLTIRDQFIDTDRAHRRRSTRQILEQARELLQMVQLEPERVLRAYPHELSGGMRQRVLIALGLLLDPEVLILDEPTTALDILTQRAIIDVLRRLKERLGFAMLFISHDLSLAAELADRVATMYAGRIVELGPVDDIFYRPAHPYTRALLDAVPTLSGETEALRSIPGSPPDLRNLPPGCPFHPRCAVAIERCRVEEIPTVAVSPGQTVACLRWQEVRRDRRQGGQRTERPDRLGTDGASRTPGETEGEG